MSYQKKIVLDPREFDLLPRDQYQNLLPGDLLILHEGFLVFKNHDPDDPSWVKTTALDEIIPLSRV